jgi:ABC-type nickel/cobalt efflux system permease component RcnA
MSQRVILLLSVVAMALITGAIWHSDVANFTVSHYLNFIQSVQKGLHIELAELLRRVETDSFGASVALISFSFLYGVFHAAGPGHGKIIISTYLLTHRSHLPRGILLSFFSSLIQGITAITVVTVSVWLFDLSMRQTRGVITDIEITSFALIMLVGFLIVVFRLFNLLKAVRGSLDQADDGDDRTHSAECGHAHGPSVRELQDPPHNGVIPWHHCINWHTALFWGNHCFVAGIFAQPQDGRYIFSACHVVRHSLNDQCVGDNNGLFQDYCHKVFNRAATCQLFTCHCN